MKRKEHKFGVDARASIENVATFIGDTLGKTLGPAGRNYQTPEGITNDGRSILGHIRFEDECDDNVALAFHEIANRTDSEVGDGTTTSIVLGAKLANTVIREIPDIDTPMPDKKSVMFWSHELEVQKDHAIDALRSKIVPVTTLEDLEKVAFTSMEDRDAAKIVARVIFEAGPNSYTALEEGFSGKIETNVQAGIEIPVKLNYGTEATATDCPVLVVNHLFEDYRELTPFMQSAIDFMKTNNVKFEALVIVGKKFSIPFMQRVAAVNMQSPLKILCLSNDYLDDALFEDVAAFVDAKYVDTHPKSGQKITDVKFQNCGMVGKVVVNPKGAVFYGGKGTKLNDVQEMTRVSARILQIQAELRDEKDQKRRAILERRIAEFKGGKATIYVDAKTAVEKYYLKLKVQDCMNSCKAALDGGMVRGGGLSLKEVAEIMPDTVLGEALMEPYKRIQENAGGSLEIGEDVYDSFLVAEAGIRNAVSVVRQLITIEGVIADHPQSMVEGLQEAFNGTA